MTLLSNPRFLSLVRSMVGELGVIYDLPNEDCHDMTLAVDEALANIICHAYRNRHDQEIGFECHVKDQQIEFTLLDRGEPPDLSKTCQPTTELSFGGRGTHLINAIMDEVCYSTEQSVNRLRLVKRLPGGGGEA